MNEFEKSKKNLKNDMLVLFILELIIFGFSVFLGKINYFSIGYAVFLLLIFFFARVGRKIAGILGIIVGILMITTILMGDIIDCILGIFIVIHSVKYNNNFKFNNVKTGIEQINEEKIIKQNNEKISTNQNNSNIIISVILLLLILLCIGGYIVYDKGLNKPNVQESDSTTIGTNDSENADKNDNDKNDVEKRYQDYMNSNKRKTEKIPSNTYGTIYKVGIRDVVIQENGDAILKFSDTSSLINKYGQNYKVATDVLFAKSLGIGNGMSEIIYFVKKDGSISCAFIASEYASDIKFIDNLGGLNYITTIYSYAPDLENVATTYGNYALDIDENVYDLDKYVYDAIN